MQNKTISLDSFLLKMLLFIAIAFALFLGYVDEGHYNFKFLMDPGAIVALLIYASLTILPAILLFQLAKRFKWREEVKIALAIIGIAIFPFILFGLFV